MHAFAKLRLEWYQLVAAKVMNISNKHYMDSIILSSFILVFKDTCFRSVLLLMSTRNLTWVTLRSTTAQRSLIKLKRPHWILRNAVWTCAEITLWTTKTGKSQPIPILVPYTCYGSGREQTLSLSVPVSSPRNGAKSTSVSSSCEDQRNTCMNGYNSAGQRNTYTYMWMAGIVPDADAKSHTYGYVSAWRRVTPVNGHDSAWGRLNAL